MQIGKTINILLVTFLGEYQVLERLLKDLPDLIRFFLFFGLSFLTIQSMLFQGMFPSHLESPKINA